MPAFFSSSAFDAVSSKVAGAGGDRIAKSASVSCHTHVVAFLKFVLGVSGDVLSHSHVFALYWADFREDQVINPAPGFGRFSGPWAPRRAPGAPGTASGLKIVQVAPKISPGHHF